MSNIRTLFVIPVYNHKDGLKVIAPEVSQYGDLLIVDDGSTDGSVSPEIENIARVIYHEENRGKGAAIATAANYAQDHGYSHIITIDADRQHFPQDIPLFLAAIRKNHDALIIGVRDFETEADTIPRSASMGRSFSNFWFRIQTGQKGADTQSGFRVYPLTALAFLNCSCSRYTFETEVLVRASWAGVPLVWQDIQVYYQKPGERISHMHRVKDNFRLSLLNTHLTLRAIIPWPHKKMDYCCTETFSLHNPIRSLRNFVRGGLSPQHIALSIAMGVLLGVLPLFALHTISILFAASFFRLSKVLSVGVSQFCAPPLVPALCIELGHRILHGKWLVDISWQSLGVEFLSRAWEWIIGALILAPVLAIIAGGIAYLIAYSVKSVEARI